MRADGTVLPVPLDEFIVKVNSRCNLNCDYCYVYNAGDTSWSAQPRRMTPGTARLVAGRIREHVVHHALDGVLISLHGGEPLLGGVDHISSLVRVFRNELQRTVPIEFSTQTNATLVNDEVADSLHSLGIRVGVSLDGTREANDRHRRDFAGRSSYDRTVAGIEALKRRSNLLTGVLCVIDLESDPVEVFEHIAALSTPSVDFLLPHGSWKRRPVGKEDAEPGDLDAPAPYGAWLVSVFRRWLADDPRRVRVRIFDDVIHLLLGGDTSFEGLGLAPCTLAVIETDGSYELVDHIKSAKPGAGFTGMHALSHSLDDLARHPSIAAGQVGSEGLASECRRCELVQTCGGGLVSHRYHHERGWTAPSVYCSDLAYLIRSIRVELTNRLERLDVATGGLSLPEAWHQP